MATIKTSDSQQQLEDNTPIKEACKSLGVPFGCEAGNCGTCIIDVVEGMENLSEPNDKEQAMGLDLKTNRLACQCHIKSGTAKIKF